MYEAKCHNLGIVPSTQVMKYLKKEDCHLDHVPLGREGAEALAQALSVNNIITKLSLSDCVLDAKVSQDSYATKLSKNWTLTLFMCLPSHKCKVTNARIELTNSDLSSRLILAMSTRMGFPTYSSVLKNGGHPPRIYTVGNQLPVQRTAACK